LRHSVHVAASYLRYGNTLDLVGLLHGWPRVIIDEWGVSDHSSLTVP